ncbi:MAG: hypothetical protein RI907_4011 [Pseudomonadota bacterium]
MLWRASELLKLSVYQGKASASFEAMAGQERVPLVANLLPAWRMVGDDRNAVAPLEHDALGAVELVVCHARTGEFVCRADPFQCMTFTPAKGAAMLNLPRTWLDDEFAGVVAWCWGALASALLGGQVEAAVSLPISGEDGDTSCIGLVCRLVAHPVGSMFFMTLNHKATGALIGCTDAVIADQLRDDGHIHWGIPCPEID